jgi:outer membrane protein assembly factor BamB
MKRRWYKWFGLAAGLVLCAEACMLMVDAPTGNEVSLRYRISGWFDNLFPGRTTTVVFTTTLVVQDHDGIALMPDDAVPNEGNAEAGGGKDDQPLKASADWPMLGGTPWRNMANPTAKNIPAQWSIEDGKLQNIKWMVQLGTKSYGGPVVADGKVFMGTNNQKPRDKTVKGQKAVVMCFNEADGKFLWQSVHETTSAMDAAPYGLCSTPCVEGKRHYYVTPLCQIVCAENDTGKDVWRYDLMKEQKVVPYHLANCSPLIVDDLLMVVTGNGFDAMEEKVASPKAPSFMALNKNTGKPVWQSNLPGEKIIDGQWSNPVVAVVDGKKQVIFPGGDCWLYSFEPKTGKLLWKFNCNPARGSPKADPDFNPYAVATPVVHDGRCYVGLGVFPDHAAPPRYGYILCVDVTGTGDVSPKNLDARDPANKGSGLVWAYGGPIHPSPKKGRKVLFGRTLSTCAVHDGLLYISEEAGYLNCFDAGTGQLYWQDDVRATVWGSPYYVDGKVYLGTEDSEVHVYEHGKQMKQLAKIAMDEGVHSTPVVANGVLYISTYSKLYAIAAKK